MLDWHSSSLVHAAPKTLCADTPGAITASTSSAPPSTAARRIGDPILELVLDFKSLFQMMVRSNGNFHKRISFDILNRPKINNFKDSRILKNKDKSYAEGILYSIIFQDNKDFDR